VLKSQKVGFGVVGLGSIAQSSVLPAFSNSKKAKLVAVVSGDRNKARHLARRFKADTAYHMKDYAACLANPDVAAVYIATPQGTHLDLTLKAAKAGKHVLCEKPLAATFEQATKMVAACRKHGVLLMTAYRKYFEPSTLHLKKLIHEGVLRPH
jgi:predicted dehydrogenase